MNDTEISCSEKMNTVSEKMNIKKGYPQKELHIDFS